MTDKEFSNAAIEAASEAYRMEKYRWTVGFNAANGALAVYRRSEDGTWVEVHFMSRNDDSIDAYIQRGKMAKAAALRAALKAALEAEGK